MKRVRCPRCAGGDVVFEEFYTLVKLIYFKGGRHEFNHDGGVDLMGKVLATCRSAACGHTWHPRRSTWAKILDLVGGTDA